MATRAHVVPCSLPASARTLARSMMISVQRFRLSLLPLSFVRLAAILAPLASVACTRPPPACQGIESNIAHFSSVETKSSLQAGLLALGPAWAEPHAKRVVSRMDAVARVWLTAQQASCAEVKSNPRSKAFPARNECLHTVIVKHQKLVGFMKTATVDTLFEADGVLDGLEAEVGDCDIPAVQAGYEPTSGAESVQHAANALASAVVMRDLRMKDAQEALTRASEEADRAGDPKLALRAALEGQSARRSARGFGQPQNEAERPTLAELSERASKLACPVEHARAELLLARLARPHPRPFGKQPVVDESKVLTLFQKAVGARHRFAVMAQLEWAVASRAGPPDRRAGWSVMELLDAEINPTPLQVDDQVATSIALELAQGAVLALGTTSPAAPNAMAVVGWLQQDKGDKQRSVECLRAAASKSEAARGASHPATVQLEVDLGRVYFNFGDHENAIAQWRRVLATREAVFGPKDFDTKQAISHLGDAYFHAKRYPEAISMFERARSAADYEGLMDSLPASKKIALAFERLGERERAMVEARAMATAFEKHQGGGTWAAEGYGVAGDILERGGAHDEAAAWYSKALRVFGHDSLERVRVLGALGTAHEGRRDFSRALKSYRASRETIERLGGKDYLSPAALAEASSTTAEKIRALCAKPYPPACEVP